jgi:hypothetical protein
VPNFSGRAPIEPLEAAEDRLFGKHCQGEAIRKAVAATAGLTAKRQANTKHLLRPTLQNLIFSSSSTTAPPSTILGLHHYLQVVATWRKACYPQSARSVSPLDALSVTTANLVQPLHVHPATSHLHQPCTPSRAFTSTPSLQLLSGVFYRL